jgi:putative tricarboxylic transport membrane protein
MDAFRVSDRVLGAVATVGAAIYLAIAWNIPAFALGTVPIQSRTFPIGLGALMLILGLGLIGKDLVVRTPGNGEGETDTDEPRQGSSGDEIVVARLADPRLEVLALLVGIAAYVVAFVPLGFVLSTVLYLVAMTWWFGFGRPIVAVVVAIGIAAITHVGLVELLGVRLPSGLLAPLGI